MYAENGIALDTWAFVDESCALRCDVSGDQAEFELGKAGRMLHLITDEDGLAMLVQVAGRALATWRATPEDERVSFTVTTAGVEKHAAVSAAST